jgi:GNAT superfamily N-acetyltransferase
MADQQKPIRNGPIEVVQFRKELAPHFERLNREWLERLFAVETVDLKYFQDPVGTIVAPGGMIFFAIDGPTVLGTGAAIRIDAERFELAKMGVTLEAQGRGIGRLVAVAAIEYAQRAGARQIELFSNSSLAPAIHLYEQLGFVAQPLPPGSEYVRSDVFMIRPLTG